MATIVSICNWALSRIAVSETINAIDEQSQPAATCNLFYDQVLDDVLRMFPWPFATRYATLALVSDDDTSIDWTYAYRYPSDALKVLRVRAAKGVSIYREAQNISTNRQPISLGPMFDEGQPYEIAGDIQGLLILSNVPEARVTYTARVTDASRFPSDFASAVAWALAAEIATPLAQSAALSERASKGLQMAIFAAQNAAGGERNPGPYPEAEATRERY